MDPCQEDEVSAGSSHRLKGFSVKREGCYEQRLGRRVSSITGYQEAHSERL